MSDEKRTAHPYHMYDAISQQPAAFGEIATRSRPEVRRLAADLAGAGQLYLVGIGTSLHAAQVGEHLFRVAVGDLPTRAYHAFDFARFGPVLRRNDVVIGISHRGNKLYTRDALQKAAQAGCVTAIITGRGGKVDGAGVRDVFETVPQDRSSAHTVSYVGAIAALALIAGETAAFRGSAPAWDDTTLGELIPSVIRLALGSEDQISGLARVHQARRRIWLAGGGPGAITAREIALKIKETSYLQAEGMSTEDMMHGPFQCSSPEDLFVLIAPQDQAQNRTLELASQAGLIGASSWIIGDAFPSDSASIGDVVTLVPSIPEPFSALSCLAPLQLFAYHLAIVHGTNPDSFRLDDPRFAAARAHVNL